jgi:hypothetical protein
MGVTAARPRTVLLRCLACVTVVAERLEVRVGVGTAVLQSRDVIHFGCLGDLTMPQALRAERVVS